MTIAEAIITVLEGAQESLSSQEIYQKIIDADLYQFKAQFPIQVVNQSIRRHCVGLNFPDRKSVV
jgi:restriction system protein